MSRYRGPKNRIARKFGVNIFGRRRNPLLHKPNPPGMHGAKRRKKSDFGIQLAEQQKLKAVYGMLTHSQLLNYYKKAVAKQGNTAHILLETLECRLDNIVYRLRFAPTIFAAQQLVSHGHVYVNGKKVDRRSFLVQPGMTITIKEKSRKMKVIQESLEDSSREIPGYLTLADDKSSGTLEVAPVADDIQFPLLINVPLVCEFLAHNH